MASESQSSSSMQPRRLDSPPLSPKSLPPALPSSSVSNNKQEYGNNLISPASSSSLVNNDEEDDDDDPLPPAHRTQTWPAATPTQRPFSPLSHRDGLETWASFGQGARFPGPPLPQLQPPIWVRMGVSPPLELEAEGLLGRDLLEEMDRTANREPVVWQLNSEGSVQQMPAEEMDRTLTWAPVVWQQDSKGSKRQVRVEDYLPMPREKTNPLGAIGEPLKKKKIEQPAESSQSSGIHEAHTEG